MFLERGRDVVDTVGAVVATDTPGVVSSTKVWAFPVSSFTVGKVTSVFSPASAKLNPFSSLSAAESKSSPSFGAVEVESMPSVAAELLLAVKAGSELLLAVKAGSELLLAAKAGSELLLVPKVGSEELLLVPKVGSEAASWSVASLSTNRSGEVMGDTSESRDQFAFRLVCEGGVW